MTKSTIVLFVVCLFLSACASKQARLVEVGSGMTQAEVRDRMGTPQDKTFRGSQEIWTYDIEGQKKAVIFEGGKVKELLNTTGTSTNHTLESGDITSHDKVNYRCAGSNDFGKFAQGGGCNMYGCWPAGGYCNQFGCSASGSCTVRHCSNPIKSVVCQD